MAEISHQFGFFVHGTQSPVVHAPCPSLDPTARIQISPDLIAIYQGCIDALINQLGKDVVLEFEPIKLPCPNCLYDSIGNRSTGRYKPGGPKPFTVGKCPECKGNGTLETRPTACIKALLQWSPKDMARYGVMVTNPQAVVRTKCLLRDAPSIIKANTAVIDPQVSDILRLRVKRLKGPVPVGLRESRYAVTFWELIDG